MNTQAAIALISDVKVKKVVVVLSLTGVSKQEPITDCLWPRVTFVCNGVERTYPLTYWKRFKDAGTVVLPHGPLPPANQKSLEHTMVDITFMTMYLAAGLRPKTHPYMLREAAVAKAKLLYKKIYGKVAVAAKKQSFVDRHATLMRKLERADGKAQLKELLLKLPHRLEKRDVIEAWQEAVVHKVMES
jgi:hypothetical protein